MFGGFRKSTCVLAAAALSLNCHSWQLASGPIHEVVPRDTVAEAAQLEVRVHLLDGNHVDLERPVIADGRLRGIIGKGYVCAVPLDSISAYEVRRFDAIGTTALVGLLGLVVLGSVSTDDSREWKGLLGSVVRPPSR